MLRHYKTINLSGKMALEKYHSALCPFTSIHFFPECCHIQVLEGELWPLLLPKGLELNWMETLHADLWVSYGKISYMNFPVPKTSSTLHAKIRSRIDLCHARVNCYKYGQMRISEGKKPNHKINMQFKNIIYQLTTSTFMQEEA